MERTQRILRYTILRLVGAQDDTISSYKLRLKIQDVLKVSGEDITQEKIRMRTDGFIDFGGGGEGSQTNSLTDQGREILGDVDALLAGREIQQ